MTYNSNLTSPCGGTNHLSFAIPASFVGCLVFLLVLLLILYPFKYFRDFCFFSKCGFLNCTSVTIFVEKFHSCYRNGLDGGRDMRSFSGLYFGLRIVSTFYFVTYRFLPQWTYEAILFLSAAMLIALVQPYKKTHMNVLNSLSVLSLLAMNCLLLSTSSKYSFIRGIEVLTISLKYFGYILRSSSSIQLQAMEKVKALLFIKASHVCSECYNNRDLIMSSS